MVFQYYPNSNIGFLPQYGSQWRDNFISLFLLTNCAWSKESLHKEVKILSMIPACNRLMKHRIALGLFTHPIVTTAYRWSSLVILAHIFDPRDFHRITSKLIICSWSMAKKRPQLTKPTQLQNLTWSFNREPLIALLLIVFALLILENKKLNIPLWYRNNDIGISM